MPTTIEWTTETWNPVLGCSVATAGCTNCYAMRMAARLAAMGRTDYVGLTKRAKGSTGPVIWSGVLRRATSSQRDMPRRLRKPSLIFVNSMSDMFHPDMPDEWRDDAFRVIREVPRHRYQVLTKRPEVARRYYRERPLLRNLPQVWIGASVERADVRWRIDELREVPAAVRFLSIEPLIGPVGPLDLRGIHWVITGGESGAGARPMRPEWVREVRDQCIAAGVAFFHKQHGTYASHPDVVERRLTVAEAQKADQNGKGGALLDGRLWREMPREAA